MAGARRQHRIPALGLVVAVAAVVLAASLSSGRAGAQSRAASYPRNETLITIGTESGPIAGFNPYFNNYAVGTVGLCIETLLRYDPLKDEYINWLAESAGFTGKKTYTVKIRPRIRWSNGQKFKGKDVAFNFKLGRFSNAFWHDLYITLKSIRVKGLTVTFRFKTTPNYIQWQNLVWNLPMINPAQGKGIDNETLTTYSPENPIGTGPYVLDPAGFDATTRVVWKKKAVWWAAQQELAPSPKPKYVIDLVDTCGGWFIHTLCDCLNYLTPLLNGVGDLENTYLPGVQTYVASGQMQTYSPKKPYNLSASTVWLTPNTTHKPLDDKRFRRALATSVNVPNVVTNNYGHLVLPANATGLLPTWNKWVDQKQLKALGFKYSTSKARRLLSAAGYRDVNGDGYVENKDGSPLDLKLAVPQGWSDWENARGMIVSSARKSGIRIHEDEGDYNYWQSQRNLGSFDLVLDNHFQLSDSPWTYYDGIFRLPVSLEQTAANFGRYQNLTAWKLSKQLDRTRSEDVAKRKAIMRKLQKIMLTEVPIIPLWYSGIWAQSQSDYWTNWPSSTSARNYTPTMWRGYMQMTGIDMITHLKSAQGGGD